MSEITKTERPILFNAEMVNAILAGRKTQTRRVINPQPTYSENTGFHWKGYMYGINSDYAGTVRNFAQSYGTCPFGQIGDRLWVRETFRYFDSSNECGCSDFPCPCPSNGTPLYKATHDTCDGEKWKPSIHMPRSACRIVLEVTKIRVERLQDITKEDAIAEGVDYSTHPSAIKMGYAVGARTNFRHTWEGIYGATSWNQNPWVWVVEFKVVQGASQ